MKQKPSKAPTQGSSPAVQFSKLLLLHLHRSADKRPLYGKISQASPASSWRAALTESTVRLSSAVTCDDSLAAAEQPDQNVTLKRCEVRCSKRRATSAVFAGFP